MVDLGIIDFYTYLLGVFIVVILPGPNSMYILFVSTKNGSRQAWAAALGVFLGDAILMLVTALGLGQLLSIYSFIFDGLKYLGSAYLAYIGITLMISAYYNYNNKETAKDKASTKLNFSYFVFFKKALLLSLLNPKAIFFFLAFFIQFVDPNYGSLIIPFLVLAITLQIASFSYLALLIYCGAKLSRVFAQNKWLNITLVLSVGMIFLYFSIHLLLLN